MSLPAEFARLDHQAPLSDDTLARLVYCRGQGVCQAACAGTRGGLDPRDVLPDTPCWSWIKQGKGARTPEPIKDRSLMSLKEKLVKISAKIGSHGRYVTFQMAEVTISDGLNDKAHEPSWLGLYHRSRS
jgi:hypothetical protein